MAREISREKCAKKMKIRRALVSKKFVDIADAAGYDTPTYHYFNPVEDGGPRNAFIFEREKIMKIFFPRIDIPKNFLPDAPTHLLVILGAHHEKSDPFDKGQATTIIMGVKPKDSGNEGDDVPTNDNYINVPIGSLDADYRVPTNDIERAEEIVGLEFPTSACREPDEKSNNFIREALSFTLIP